MLYLTQRFKSYEIGTQGNGLSTNLSTDRLTHGVFPLDAIPDRWWENCQLGLIFDIKKILFIDHFPHMENNHRNVWLVLNDGLPFIFKIFLDFFDMHDEWRRQTFSPNRSPIFISTKHLQRLNEYHSWPHFQKLTWSFRLDNLQIWAPPIQELEYRTWENRIIFWKHMISDSLKEGTRSI